jgi:hypothetical protein
MVIYRIDFSGFLVFVNFFKVDNVVGKLVKLWWIN